MLYYDRTDISQGIDPTTNNKSKEYMILHYWFFNQGFKFQDSVCNGCNSFNTPKPKNISGGKIFQFPEVVYYLQQKVISQTI